MLNPLLLRSFLALVRSGSFSDAAAALGISQPTVSQHIQKLEEQLGATLIHRARNGCEPTRAARALLPFAESLVRLNARAVNAVRGGDLRVGASSNIGIYLLQPYLRSFIDGSASVHFELAIDRNPAIAAQLENGEIDVALMEWWSPLPGFRARPWRREPVVLIVPPGHALAERGQLRREDLRDLALLGGEPGTGTGRLLSLYFGDAAPAPRAGFQLGSTEAVKQAVMAGIGVSLVLASAVAAEVRAGRLKAIPLTEPPLHKELFVIRRAGEPDDALAAAFERHLFERGDDAGRAPEQPVVATAT